MARADSAAEIYPRSASALSIVVLPAPGPPVITKRRLVISLFKVSAVRCGRDASCPTPPAQIPACGFPAPGSSGRRACARPVTQESARPLREVGWCAPALPVRHTLPLRAPSHRHPLPHVDGSPGRRGRCGAPTPAPACAVRLVVAWASLVEPGLTRVSHVPDPALHAYHGLRWTPAAPRDAHQHAASVEASGACKPSPSACWP